MLINTQINNAVLITFRKSVYFFTYTSFSLGLQYKVFSRNQNRPRHKNPMIYRTVSYRVGCIIVAIYTMAQGHWDKGILMLSTQHCCLVMVMRNLLFQCIVSADCAYLPDSSWKTILPNDILNYIMNSIWLPSPDATPEHQFGTYLHHRAHAGDATVGVVIHLWKLPYFSSYLDMLWLISQSLWWDHSP
jgi:hypothetical protein